MAASQMQCSAGQALNIEASVAKKKWQQWYEVI
jgi:hypothetical protein